MGGSVKENMYKGGPWAPEEILGKGLAATCYFPQVAALASTVMLPDPWVQLEPITSAEIINLIDGLHR